MYVVMYVFMHVFIGMHALQSMY